MNQESNENESQGKKQLENRSRIFSTLFGELLTGEKKKCLIYSSNDMNVKTTLIPE